jgi:hypothetical protein
MRIHALALVTALSLAPLAAAAQAPNARPDSSAARVRRTAISVSPLSVLLGAFGGDVEHAISPSTTLGLGLTYEDRNSLFFEGDARGDYDLDGSVKFRYYPHGRALDGVAVAALVGGTVYRRNGPPPPERGDDGLGDDEGGNLALTIGFSADYNKLVGANRRFLIGTGLGMKRRFVRDRNYFDSLTALRPTLRAVLGYAF